MLSFPCPVPGTSLNALLLPGLRFLLIYTGLEGSQGVEMCCRLIVSPFSPCGCSRDGMACCTSPWSRCRGGHSRSTSICHPDWTQHTSRCAPVYPEQRLRLEQRAGRERSGSADTAVLWFSISSTPAFPGLFSGTAVPSHIWLFHVWPEMAFLLMVVFPLHAGS